MTSLQGNIDSLCFRLCKADPEDFELDKSSNYDMVTNVGMRNNCRAQLLLGTYEVRVMIIVKRITFSLYSFDCNTTTGLYGALDPNLFGWQRKR